MKELIKQAADIITKSGLTIALTGAGISVESGIPDFRSPGGLWSIYDPSEYATISAFISTPEKVWEMAREMTKLIDAARPNSAHKGMADLEKMGYLHHIITQNVDNLHQEAGSSNVIEYHGNISTLTCLKCGQRFKRAELHEEFPPRCICSSRMILKPDVIFFGEAIPEDAMNRSFQLASHAEALMVVGTSAVVSPANTIPSIAKTNGAKVIEINKDRTHLTGTITDVFLNGDAGMIMTEILAEIRKIVG
ncbi:NAD-dependent protein deacylase [uncultured Desulfobacterium sp.]|uniref:protein acetyllysine N-acetyltransferase n=1 Tax=uncultured Desulfobacterium sp. TaxID=201089 RepID=A0A445N0I3_9BACT|nr:NAD-dependent protein deacylase [uncultured Desulfobacterium sp.]